MHYLDANKTAGEEVRRQLQNNFASNNDELISDVLLWTPTYGRAKAGRPVRTYIQQLCEDTGCSPEDLPDERWGEVVREGQGYPC